MLGNYGRIFAEYVHLKNFRNNKLSNYISIDGIEYLRQIKKDKQKIVDSVGLGNHLRIVLKKIK